MVSKKKAKVKTDPAAMPWDAVWDYVLNDSYLDDEDRSLRSGSSAGLQSRSSVEYTRSGSSLELVDSEEHREDVPSVSTRFRRDGRKPAYTSRRYRSAPSKIAQTYPAQSLRFSTRTRTTSRVSEEEESEEPTAEDAIVDNVKANYLQDKRSSLSPPDIPASFSSGSLATSIMATFSSESHQSNAPLSTTTELMKPILFVSVREVAAANAAVDGRPHDNERRDPGESSENTKSEVQFVPTPSFLSLFFPYKEMASQGRAEPIAEEEEETLDEQDSLDDITALGQNGEKTTEEEVEFAKKWRRARHRMFPRKPVLSLFPDEENSKAVRFKGLNTLRKNLCRTRSILDDINSESFSSGGDAGTTDKSVAQKSEHSALTLQQSNSHDRLAAATAAPTDIAFDSPDGPDIKYRPINIRKRDDFISRRRRRVLLLRRRDDNGTRPTSVPSDATYDESSLRARSGQSQYLP